MSAINEIVNAILGTEKTNTRPDPYAVHGSIIANSGKNPVTPKRLARVTEIQGDWQVLWRAENVTHTEDGSRSELNALMASDQFKSKSELRQRHEIEKFRLALADRQNEARENKEKLALEAAQIANDIWAEFSTIADEVLATEEKEERDRFEKFGIEHQPSGLIIALRACVADAKRRAANPLGHNAVSGKPADMLPFLKLKTA